MNIILEELNYIYNYNPYHDEKDLFSSNSFLFALDSLTKMSNKDIIYSEEKYEKYSNSNKRGDFIKEIYNKSPKILTLSEKDEKLWNKMTKNNFYEIYRVVENKKYEEDYLNGNFVGDGKRGSGHYFFSDENKMENFGKGYEDRRVIIGKINKKDLLNEKDLLKIKDIYNEKAYNSGIDNSRLVDNDGALAALLNVKAIKYNDGTILVLDKESTTILRAL